MIPYVELDKYFTRPKNISPFFNNTRIPRKLKKKVKLYSGVHWKNLDNGQLLWLYLESKNLNYKRFIVKCICETEKN